MTSMATLAFPAQESECFDGNLHTSCVISGPSPSLLIDTHGLFFNKIILHSTGSIIFGVIIEVFAEDNATPFWSHQIKNQDSFHLFDLGEVALSHFPVYIADTFSYNGELAALFHIQYLYRVVNEFILVESWFTHSGVRKPFLFFQQPNISSQFAPYMDKITYLIIEEIPPRPDDYLHAWLDNRHQDTFWRENYQRRVGREYLQSRANDPSSMISFDKTLVLCVDSDEIFDRTILAAFRDLNLYPGLFSQHHKVKFGLALFYYNFKWLYSRSWEHAFLTDLRSYLEIDDFLEARVTGGENTYFIQKSGWHLSYFTSIDDIIRKIESMAHREFDLEEFKEREEVVARVKEGKDLYHREDMVLNLFDVETNAILLPEGWEEFQMKLLELQEK
jgi:hypothetical protein